MLGGDGAESRGGEDARHSSTGTAELISRHLFPDAGFDLSHWDLFHRDEVSARWALQESAYATEIFTMGQLMVQLFGIGSGRVLLRGVATLLADHTEKVRALRPGEGDSTRPMAYGHRVTDSLYRNYRLYHAGLEARLEMRRQGHHGQSNEVNAMTLDVHIGCNADAAA